MNGIRRGDVLLIDFDPVEGSEAKGTRPAIVLSVDRLNRPGLPVLVAPVTSQNTDKIYGVEYLIEAGEGGLEKRSKVQLRLTRGVSPTRIIETYGRLSAEMVDEICEVLLLYIGMGDVLRM